MKWAKTYNVVEGDNVLSEEKSLEEAQLDHNYFQGQYMNTEVVEVTPNFASLSNLFLLASRCHGHACKLDLNGESGAEKHRDDIMEKWAMFDKSGIYIACVNFIDYCNENNFQ